MHNNGCHHTLPEICFYYQNNTLQIDSVLRRISEELNKFNHPSDQIFSLFTIAFFSFLYGTCKNSVRTFNRMFNWIVTADLNQYILFSCPSTDEFNYRIGPFKIGSFSADRLAYQSKKAGSDFYDRYRTSLQTLPLSVERDYRTVKVVDWDKLFTNRDGWETTNLESLNTWKLLIDRYYSTLSERYFVSFYRELDKLQEIPVAMGTGWLDPSLLQKTLGAWNISVFLNIGDTKRGFVTPSLNSLMTVDLGVSHVGVPLVERTLDCEFQISLTDLCDIEVHQCLKSFCHFIALARKHNQAGRRTEGFLHHVIALDFLLGNVDKTTLSIAQRVAVLTHRGMEVSFEEANRIFKKIYDQRSGYVHRGEGPDDSWCKEVEFICSEILFCLLRLQRHGENRESGFLDKWLKQIDYLAGALEAGKDVKEDEYIQAGIAGEADFRATDLRKALSEERSPQAR